MPQINQSKLCWLFLHPTVCCFLTEAVVLFQGKPDKFMATDGEFMTLIVAGMEESRIEEMGRGKKKQE